MMNKLGLGVLLVCWMLLTLVLVGSLIGMLLFTEAESGQTSSWMLIGRRLTTKITDS